MQIAPFSATGIGSLPYPDPAPATDLIFAAFPSLPHWPQLPRRGAREGMVHQFFNPLVTTGLLTVKENRTFFATSGPDWPQRLTEFYGLALAAEDGDAGALEHFAMPPSAALGFYAFLSEVDRRGTAGIAAVKGQIAGPLSAAFFIKDEQGKAAYYDDQLRDLVVRTLALSARWQARALSRFGLPVMIFIDDPGIDVYGSSNYITVTREMVREDLQSLAEGITAGGGLPGLHSCDAIDWSIPLTLPLAVVSVDTYNFFGSLLPFARELKTFLERGGTIAWGIVPTSGPDVGIASPRELVHRLTDQWEALNARDIPRATLAERSLITPACGTGLLSAAQAEEIYRSTAAVARMLGEARPC